MYFALTKISLPIISSLSFDAASPQTSLFPVFGPQSIKDNYILIRIDRNRAHSFMDRNFAIEFQILSEKFYVAILYIINSYSQCHSF
jgi:hypothetical protein